MTKYEKIQLELKDVVLFKRDILGNVLYWYAKVATRGNDIVIASYYGQLNERFRNSNPSSISEPMVSTNLGKSNERTPLEQAIFSLQSAYNDKLKKGYKKYDSAISSNYNIEVIENTVSKQNTGLNDLAQPMKFKPFEFNKCKYPMWGQPKLNGVRCISLKSLTNNSLFDSYPTSFLSKELTEYTAEHLNQFIHDVFNTLLLEIGIKNAIVDGELYIPYTKVATIAGAAKNINNPLNSKLQYIIYDIAIDNIPQEERLNIIGFLEIPEHSNNFKNPTVYKCPRHIINSDIEAIEYLDICLKAGYEGCVLRPKDKEYAFGQRPSFNRKLKRFQDAEFEILDIIEYGTRGQKVGYGCKFICRNDINNLSFEAVPKGDYNERVEYVINKSQYIGKKATIKFYERTINELPFHGNVIAIRDYE